MSARCQAILLCKSFAKEIGQSRLSQILLCKSCFANPALQILLCKSCFAKEIGLQGSQTLNLISADIRPAALQPCNLQPLQPATYSRAACSLQPYSRVSCNLEPCSRAAVQPAAPALRHPMSPTKFRNSEGFDVLHKAALALNGPKALDAGLTATSTVYPDPSDIPGPVLTNQSYSSC